MNLHHLVSTYGYGLVAGVVAVESVGIPFPGETAVIVAGAYAGSTHRLSPWLVFAAASLGAIVGDSIGFTIGRHGGYRLLRRFGHYIRVNERELKVARYIFDRHGPKVIFLGRFVSILRTFAAFLAGTSRMRWGRFIPWNASGGIVWAGIYTFASYRAGAFIERSSTVLNLIFGAVAVVIIVSVVVVVRRRTESLIDRAEVAYPGPLEDRGRTARREGR